MTTSAEEGHENSLWNKVGAVSMNKAQKASTKVYKCYLRPQSSSSPRIFIILKYPHPPFLVMFLYTCCVLCLLATLIAWLSSRGLGKLRVRTGSSKLPLPALKRSRKKPLWVVNAVIRIKALCPNHGCTKIAHAFNRLYVHRGMSVSRSYVAYTVRNHQYDILQYRRRVRSRRPGRYRANRSWAMDLTGKQDAYGRINWIVGVLDQGTRRVLCLNVIPSKCSWVLLGHLFLAIGRYGKPKALKSDNESIFKSRLFRAVLALCGIRQEFSVVGCPWMNGRVERFFGTLKQALDCWQIADAQSLQHSLGQFLFFYNHIRPHESLDGQTPIEAWEGIDPYRTKPKRVSYFTAWDGLLTGFYIRR
jgi:transposase InsO family protein